MASNSKKIYERLVAAHYQQAHNIQVLSCAHDSAWDQLQKHNQKLADPMEFLEFGIGDGAYLQRLKSQYPSAHLSGIDLSPAMLDNAKKIISFTAYCLPIEESTKHLPLHQFSLINAHFINCYIPFPIILQQAQQLLKPSGSLLSIVGNTLSSFPKGQAVLQKNLSHRNPFIRYVMRHALAALASSNNLRTSDEATRLMQPQFILLEQALTTIPLCFNTADEYYQFFFAGSWFSTGLQHPLVPLWLTKKIAKYIIHQILSFPFHDEMKVLCTLATPKSPSDL